jgi:hypothetical protein
MPSMDNIAETVTTIPNNSVCQKCIKKSPTGDRTQHATICLLACYPTLATSPAADTARGLLNQVVSLMCSQVVA